MPLSQRHQKILVAMFQLADGAGKPCKYEDIVVKAFRLFPEEFQLRGYPQYPDSSDIHKPLYGPLKRLGLVKAANKYFSLTSAGLDTASRLVSGKRRERREPSGARMSRDHVNEVSRLLKTSAMELLLQDQRDRILDTDFYSYLGVTVRTPRNDFLGRMAAVSGAIAAAQSESFAGAPQLGELHAYLVGRFAGLIAALTGKATR